jgi:hypothetical protein
MTLNMSPEVARFWTLENIHEALTGIVTVEDSDAGRITIGATEAYWLMVVLGPTLEFDGTTCSHPPLIVYKVGREFVAASKLLFTLGTIDGQTVVELQMQILYLPTVLKKVAAVIGVVGLLPEEYVPVLVDTVL